VAKKPGRLARLTVWDAASFNAAGLVGPGLAGLLALSLGARWGAYLVAALLLTAAPFAARLPRRTTIAAALGVDPRPRWHPVWAQRRLIRATLTSALSYFGMGMLWVGAPLLGLSAAHRAGLGSLLLSVLSAAALIFSLGLGRWSAKRPDFVVGLSTAVMASGFILVGFVPTIWGAGAAFAAIGAADGPQLAALIRIRHRDAPQGLVGQVFTWGSSLKVGAAALGSALAGVIGAHSLTHLFWAAALVQLLALALFLLWPTRRPAPDR
jgi:MFS family permease